MLSANPPARQTANTLVAPKSRNLSQVFIGVLFSLYALSGCVYSPGLKVDNLPLPQEEVTTTPEGLNLKVIPITTETLPASRSAQASPAIRELFSHSTPIYTLERGDVLSINLWQNPEITPPAALTSALSGYVVDQRGFINFPLVGDIRAQGKTIESFSRDLNQRLARYLKRPDAQAKVIAYNGRKYFIDGEVKQPGQYAITDQPPTLFTALTNAGGNLATADMTSIMLTRNGAQLELNLPALQQQGLNPSYLYLKQGDSIHVPSRETRKLYLIGEAGNPAPLLIPDLGMTLANVLGEGKGLNPTSASAAKVYVVRDNSTTGQTDIYHIDLSNLANFALANRFRMQPNDMVYIDATGLVRWSRVINLIIPSAGAIRTAQVIGAGN